MGTASVFDSMSTLREPLRCRILLLLEGQELTHLNDVIEGINADQDGSSKRLEVVTDNGDGTVTDELTGLIWLRKAGCDTLPSTKGTLN